MIAATDKNASKVTALRELGATPPGGYRAPPHNYEAEQALLGAIIENNLAYEKVSEFLRPEHFAEGIHGRIFEAIGKLVRRGHTADLVTLKNFFESDAHLAEIGGTEYLSRRRTSLELDFQEKNNFLFKCFRVQLKVRIEPGSRFGLVDAAGRDNGIFRERDACGNRAALRRGERV